jgi:hypothetical protein
MRKNSIAIKKIETKEDMILWANAINSHPVSIAEKCDFQDIWGHSDRKTIDRLFIEANGSRSLIICSVQNVMAYEEVEHLLKTWATDKANKIINAELETLTADHIKKYNEVVRQENTLNEGKRAIYRKISSLKDLHERLTRQNADLLKRIAEYRQETRAAKQQCLEYEEKAAKYDAIKQALT